MPLKTLRAQLTAALERVRAGADIMPRRQLEKVLVAELGPAWRERLADFEYDPLAAASIGQARPAAPSDARVDPCNAGWQHRRGLALSRCHRCSKLSHATLVYSKLCGHSVFWRLKCEGQVAPQWHGNTWPAMSRACHWQPGQSPCEVDVYASGLEVRFQGSKGLRVYRCHPCLPRAQVHRATLHDGRKVALKIQYPGVARSIESDVDNLLRLISYANILPKGLYVEAAAKVRTPCSPAGTAQHARPPQLTPKLDEHVCRSPDIQAPR